MTRQEWNADIDAYIAEEKAKAGKPVVASESIPNSWPQVHSFISPDVIRTYVWDMGYNDPLYYDSEYARKSRWKGMIAPPGRFVHYIAETGYLPRGRDIPGVNHLYGGTIYDYYDVMREGETYTIKDEYLGVEEKKLPPEKAGKYRLLTMTSKRSYINQDGKTVVTATGSTIITCTYPEDIKKGASAIKAPDPHRYSEEELEELHKYYEDYTAGKYTRGGDIRYWEDVKEGDEIPVLKKGPLDLMDMIGFLCATGAMHGSGATKWKNIRPNAKVSPRDPETGEVLHRQMMHLSPQVARGQGFPNSLSYGAMSEAYVSEFVTDWAGDDAFVKRLSHKHRRAIFHGDMLIVSGYVSKKYIENGEHLVEITISGKNQAGVEICPSSAIVKLVSRED